MSRASKQIDTDPFFLWLKALLRRNHPRRLALQGFSPTAVLLLLWRQDGRLHLLFIRRSERVRVHKGEISFPGGHKDEQDMDLCHTAVRETHEEVGIPQEKMAILGQLDDAFTLSRHIMTPYVAALPGPHSFHPSEEVAELIPIPVSRLFHPDRFTLTFRALHDRPVAVYTYEFNHRVIWGATARILRDLLMRLQGHPGVHNLIS